MAQEEVLIEVEAAPEKDEAIGRVTARFNMRNNSAAPEAMQVRFPLADPRGGGSGMGDFPEVTGFTASLGDSPLPTTVITTANPTGRGEPVRWAAFDVTFPPGEETVIRTNYIITSTGYPPQARFGYVMETGAGWQGPIGSADIIVRLPYPATNENVFYGEGLTSEGGQLSGNEIRWHWDNLEPTRAQNIFVSMLTPQAWTRILAAREEANGDPQNAQKLVALAQAYDAAVTSRFPLDNDDRFAALADETMSRAVALEPNSSAFHLAYAQLIWDNMTVQALLSSDDPNLKRVLAELGAALALEPDNAEANLLLSRIRANVEGEVVLPNVQVTPGADASPSIVEADVTVGPPTPVSTPTAVEMPTAGVSTVSPGGGSPIPEDTPVAPLTPDAVRPTSTAFAAPPGPQDSSTNVPLVLMMVLLPLALAAIIYAAYLGRKRRPEAD
jgi:hypothetical protein